MFAFAAESLQSRWCCGARLINMLLFEGELFWEKEPLVFFCQSTCHTEAVCRLLKYGEKCCIMGAVGCVLKSAQVSQRKFVKVAAINLLSQNVY